MLAHVLGLPADHPYVFRGEFSGWSKRNDYLISSPSTFALNATVYTTDRVVSRNPARGHDPGRDPKIKSNKLSGTDINNGDGE